MLNKNCRNIEVYMKAGALMRLYKTLAGRLLTEISKVLSAADQDMLMNAMKKIDTVCSRAEDNMFRDHPELPSIYIDVFYGSTNVKPQNKVDAEIIELAKEVADELFQ